MNLGSSQLPKQISLEQVNRIRAEGSELNQYFYDEGDSLLSLQGIFPETEFRAIAKQLEIDPINRQSIAYKFYRKPNPKPESFECVSKYYVQYLQWKAKPEQEKHPEAILQQQVVQKMQDKLIDRQLELMKYKEMQHKQHQQKRQMELRKNLGIISQQYHSKLNSVLSEPQPTSNMPAPSKVQPALPKTKKLGFSKFEYPLILATNLDEQELKLKKQKQKLKEASYISLVKNPPKLNHISIKNKISQEMPIKTEENQLQIGLKQNVMSKRQWRLDVEEMLKMPWKQFLLFYEHYENKIVALTSVQQLKRINMYRKAALEKQEALQKLKVKVAQSGNGILGKLSQEKKKQLFQLLYQEEVQEGASKFSHYGEFTKIP